MKIKFDLYYDADLTLAEAILGKDAAEQASLVKSLVKGIMNFADKIKNDNSVKLLDLFKSRFALMLGKKLKEYSIYADVNNVEFEKTGQNSLNAAITIDKLNYTELAEAVLSKAPLWLPEGREGDLIEDIAGVLGEDGSAIIYLLLKLVSDAKKEKIIALCVDAYNSELCRELTKLFKENGIALKAEKIEVI